MRKILNIMTPENVYVEYELAGLGSRFVALLIDHFLQLVIILTIAIGAISAGIDVNNTGGFDSLLVAAGIVIIFIVFFGYFTFFELIMKGQSPGKKIMKLRVIRQNGEPVGFFDSLIRNILRIADMLPSLYFIGAGFLIFTKYYKRIGDIAANTIVVKVRREEKLLTADLLMNDACDEDNGDGRLNIYPVNNMEYTILKEFMARKEKLGKRKPVFEYHLNSYFMKKFNIASPPSDPGAFFEAIVKMNSGI